MIVFSPDHVARLRSFLNEINPHAARRAMAAILAAPAGNSIAWER